MTQQQRDKVQAILAKGLPIRPAQTISTPRLTNSTVPTTTTTTVRAYRSIRLYPSVSVLGDLTLKYD